MKCPSFQFYPGDWLRNSNLRRCSHAARGAWLDVLCLMHDADEYGVLRWPLEDIAQASGVTVSLLNELSAKGVLKGSDAGCEAFVYRPRHAGKEGDPVELIAGTTSPCWYSSRFVRDEHVRLNRGKSTQFTPDNQPEKTPTGTPKVGIGCPVGDGASTASAISSTKKDQKPRRAAHAGLDNVAIPDWLPSQTWADFVTARSQMSKRLTTLAAKRAIEKLTELRQQGHDPVAVINQSIMSSWSGLFPVKGGSNATNQPQRLSADQRARLDNEQHRIARESGRTFNQPGSDGSPE